MNSNIQKIKSELIKHHLDAILISSVPLITYLTGYSGFDNIEREGFILVTEDTGILFTDGRYIEAVKDLPNITAALISRVSPLTKLLKKTAFEKKLKTVGVQEDNLSVLEYKKFSKCFPTLKHWEASALRKIKEPSEIANIEQACMLGDKAFEHVLQKIKPGVTEKNLAFELEFFIKKQGADISFKPIVAFGKHAAVPHHLTSDCEIRNNEFVLLDFGAQVNNYCSDMARTVFFGKASVEQKKMHTTVLEAQKLAIQQLNNTTIRSEKGVPASSIDKAARTHIISKGYPTIPHSVGHSIGIEVHEAPRLSPNSKDLLTNGMVFSVEPGIYIPGFGGVRIEDLVVMEKNIPRLLTQSKRELIEI